MLHRFSILLLYCFLLIGLYQNSNAQSPETINTESAAITTKVVATEEVYFDFGKHDLRAEGLARLEAILEQLENNEAVILKITAHTDAIGSDGANQMLSQKRGEAVRSYLVTKGVPDSLMQVAVYGESTPVASNSDDDGRQQNRRATVEVIRQKPVVSKPKVPMSYVEGTVVDKETGEGIPSTIIIRSKTFHDSLQTDEKGYFKKEVPLNAVIGIDVYAPGYFFETQMMKVTGMNLPTLEFRLPPATVGAIATIKDLFFQGNKALLLRKSESTLPKVLLFMQVNKDIKIEIGGHVNYPRNKSAAYKRGAGDFEQDLSDRRAKMVYDFLLENNIPVERMSWKGYSNTQMKFPTTSLEREMAENRRVEIKVVE
ncbi:MAG: outer membrane protein OmpA-like peptidoglycan-associated protein [Polaribacter sp.]|jgi:outer membrane protein OmpA-like peptidoglycan-associated protein